MTGTGSTRLAGDDSGQGGPGGGRLPGKPRPDHGAGDYRAGWPKLPGVKSGVVAAMGTKFLRDPAPSHGVSTIENPVFFPSFKG